MCIPTNTSEFLKLTDQLKEQDTNSLALGGSKYAPFSVRQLLQQIEGKQKAKTKLPEWYENSEIIYPPRISMEQCSSQQAAEFKGTIIQGNHLLDLTGGAGVDSYHLSKNFNNVTYCEQNEELVKLAEYNFGKLGARNIECIASNSLEYLEKLPDLPSHIYVDPARRDNSKMKVHAFEDCEPNVLEVVPNLLEKGCHVLIKASPMLDIKLALKQLPPVFGVYVLAIRNDCKELLFHLHPDKSQQPVLSTINLTAQGTESFIFTYAEEQKANADFNEPEEYLYEPNVAVMKAGAFDAVARRFELAKLNPNTHLYTSDILENDFPGRKFKIDKVSSPNKKDLLKSLDSRKVSITTRNYPLSVPEIKKKYGLEDGDNSYLFFFRGPNNKPTVLICSKLA